MRPIVEGLGILPAHSPSVSGGLEHSLVWLCRTTALKLIVLTLTVRSLKELDVSLERLLSDVLAPNQKLDGLAVIGNRDRSDRLVALAVNLLRCLPSLVKYLLALLGALRCHNINANKARECLVL